MTAHSLGLVKSNGVVKLVLYAHISPRSGMRQ
jgi:hypothetical protein